jgi:anti-anti-sigma regulatory factor
MKSSKYKKNIEKFRSNGKELPSKHEMIKISMSNEEFPTYLIIDCSMFSYVDFSGITILKKTIQSFEDIGIKTVLAGVPVHIESMFGKEGFYEDISSNHLYKSVHDAVAYILDESTDDNDNDLNFFYINNQSLSSLQVTEL